MIKIFYLLLHVIKKLAILQYNAISRIAVAYQCNRLTINFLFSGFVQTRYNFSVLIVKNEIMTAFKMISSNNTKPENWVRKFTKSVTRIVHAFIELVVRCLMQIIYRGPGDSMPPIKDLVLLESASSLALKIRTKKVSK